MPRTRLKPDHRSGDFRISLTVQLAAFDVRFHAVLAGFASPAKDPRALAVSLVERRIPSKAESGE